MICIGIRPIAYELRLVRVRGWDCGLEIGSSMRRALRQLRKASRHLLWVVKGKPSRASRIGAKPSELPLSQMELVRDRNNRVPDWCTPINDGVWRSVDDTEDTHDGDPVLGFVSGSSAWALPWWIMKNHHAANLTLDGEPVLIAFCETCAGAAAFTPVLDGTRYNLRVDGIYDGVILLTDFETASLWSPFTGHSLHGDLKGQQFERRPVIQCTWGEWKSEHPNTVVLSGDGESRDGHGAQFVNPNSSSPSFTPQERTALRRDRRLSPDRLVLGVAVNDLARAYPIDLLHASGGVVNDELGGKPILCMAKPNTWIAVAFERQVNGTVLEFDMSATGQVVDRASGSEWDNFGQAVDGPMAGQRLRFVPSGLEKWRSWHGPHPGTEIFEPRRARGSRNS